VLEPLQNVLTMSRELG